MIRRILFALALFLLVSPAWAQFVPMPGMSTIPTVAATCGTWNPSDKTSNVTLSSGNNTATTTSSAAAGVRSTDSKSSGKLYWEITLTTGYSTIDHGFANSSESLTVGSNAGHDNNGLFSVNTFGIYLNNSQIIAGTPAANGNVAEWAVDFGAQKFWVRWHGPGAPNSYWNQNATYVPGDANGVSFSSMAAGPYFIMFADTNSGDVVTLNTGCQTFTDSVPSGFTAWQ